MRISVDHEATSRNIEFFKKLLCPTQGYQEQLSAFYSIYIHRRTGEMCLFNEVVALPEEDWKLLLVAVQRYEEGDDGISIEVVPDKRRYAHLPTLDLQRRAYGVLTETLDVLRQVAHHAQRVHEAFEKALIHLQCIQIETSRELIFAAWHDVDRREAERLLFRESPGFYLFRKEGYTADLEAILRRYDRDVVCVTLTYREGAAKIVDRTLVYQGRGWLFYDDDLSLRGERYLRLTLALDVLGGALHCPLLRENELFAS